MARPRRHPSSPSRAVVLAAGYGTRLAPLTRSMPKALVPLWGAPMVLHGLRLLRDWGVRDVLLNCHAHADRLMEWVQAHPVDGLRLAVSHEPRILGTGGALRHAAWFLGQDPFWLLNADVAADLDPAPLLARSPAGRTLASVWVEPERGPRTVRLHRGRVVSFRDGRPGSPGSATLCGLHLVSPRVLEFIPPGFSTIVGAYQEAMRQGLTVRGVAVPDAFWADIGTPDQYLDAHAEVADRYRPGAPGSRLMDPALRLRRRGVAVRGFAAVDPSASVAAGARLHDTVVWAGAGIGPHARLERAVVGQGATVDVPARRLVAPASTALSAAEGAAARAAGWPPETTTVECLPPRPGSGRTFTRLHRQGRSAMLIGYDPQREENRLYAPLARFLAGAGAAVPAVLHDDPDHCLTVFEDVGDQSLQSRVPRADADEVYHWYRRILDQSAAWHGPITRAARRRRVPLMEPFGPALFRREHALFAEHALAPTPGATDALRRAVLADLRSVSRRLTALPPVLLHRDLQSSNLYWHRDEWVRIDFQGMRYGPAAYDLASLLCDPYLSLPLALQLELVQTVPADHASGFWFAAIQRLTQALGAYGRLAALPGNAAFAQYAPPARHMLRRAVRLCGARLAGLDTWLDMADPSHR